MLLAPDGSRLASDPAIEVADHDDVPRLVAQVRAVFPDLRFTDARLEDRGGDHRILILDRSWAIRFPRAGTHGLAVEIAVLDALRRVAVLPTPDYSLIDPAGAFAGYPLIDGVELTPERFSALDVGTRHAVLDQVAAFLAALHRLSPADLWKGDWPKAWTPVDYVRRARSGRTARITRRFPGLSSSLSAFYADYGQDRPYDLVILHGDLVSDHLLLTEAGDRLAGIIDFGDIALGDPAQDLMGLWAYGPDAVARVVAAYDPGGRDPGLRRRSYGAFVRYRIDGLADALEEEGAGNLLDEVARLDALLADYARRR